MNVLGKAGFALLALGGLIFIGMIIWGIVRVVVELFTADLNSLLAQLIVIAITAIIMGIILMLLSALYDRYRSVKTEEVHERV
jgi:undecaprenyl pyrophosphate phosphatase UppP